MGSEHNRGGQRSPTVVSGPLAGYSAGFRQALIDRGYARRTIGDQMSMMAHLGRWLQAEGLGVTALQSAAEIDRFFAERRACGYRARISSMALAGLLGFLREHEILGPATKPLAGPAGCWPNTGSTCPTSAAPQRARSAGSPHAPPCSSRPSQRPGNRSTRR